MTEWAPAAMALVMSPDCVMPPSAIRGTPVLAAISAQSIMAVIWGTPMPAITRVVQIVAGPIPTLMASAPAAVKSAAASAVAILPAMRSVSGYLLLKCSMASSTPRECPCAVSITMTSTPCSISAVVRSSASPPTPTAAPTRKRPRSSLQALGYWIVFSMSLTVIKPFKMP